MDKIQEHVQNWCRVCMLKDDPNMESIYCESEDDLITIIDIIHLLVPNLQISESDNLPQKICEICKNNLIIVFRDVCKIRELCIKSEEEMKQFIEVYEAEQNSELLLDNNLSNTSLIKMEQEILELNDNSLNHKIESDIEYNENLIPTDEEDVIVKKERVKKVKQLHTCNVCNKQFDKAYRLLRHSNIHNAEGKPFECLQYDCHQRFASESNLMRHSIVHSNVIAENTSVLNEKPKIYKCNECDKEFLKQESLSSHMKTHKDRIHTEFACEFCSKKFTKINLLTRHAKTHEEMKSHICNICNKTFALGGQLIDHLNKHKGIKPHVCGVCHKGFQQSCTLKDHLRIHSGETPFLCSECGKAFNNSSNLRQHLIRHSGQKPYACNQCPSRFSCKAGLKSHIQTHTGVKPYVCDVCGSAFTKPYSLAKHKRIHTGEKPYICEVCPMRFNSSDHLKRHMRTHTGEKPYKCRFCERAFAQSNDLVKHTRSHVGDNTYQCNECDSRFRLHSELRAHIRNHFLQHQQNSNSEDMTKYEEDTSNENIKLEDIEKTSYTEIETMTSTDDKSLIYDTNSTQVVLE